jgi:hypothetical protein
LQHPTWPIVKDNRGSLIPLEMLYVEKDQVLTRCGQLNSMLMDKLRRYLKEGCDVKIRAEANKFFDDFASKVDKPVSEPDALMSYY